MEGRRPEGERPIRNGRGLADVSRRKREDNKGKDRVIHDRSHRKDVQEKLIRVETRVTVLKLTQVGGLSILRRSGEYWLRNSAK